MSYSKRGERLTTLPSNMLFCELISFECALALYTASLMFSPCITISVVINPNFWYFSLNFCCFYILPFHKENFGRTFGDYSQFEICFDPFKKKRHHTSCFHSFYLGRTENSLLPEFYWFRKGNLIEFLLDQFF